MEEIDEVSYRKDHLPESHHCQVCDRIFSSSSSRKRHAKMHEQPRMDLPKVSEEQVKVQPKFEYVCTLSVCRNLDSNKIFLQHHSQ